MKKTEIEKATNRRNEAFKRWEYHKMNMARAISDERSAYEKWVGLVFEVRQMQKES